MYLRLCSVQRTFREIMFLQELTMHDNIIKCALLTPTDLLPLIAAFLLILASSSWQTVSSLRSARRNRHTQSGLRLRRAGIAFLQSLHSAIGADLAYMNSLLCKQTGVCMCLQAGECVQSRE